MLVIASKCRGRVCVWRNPLACSQEARVWKNTPMSGPMTQPTSGNSTAHRYWIETLNGSCGVPDAQKPRGGSWKQPERPWSEPGATGPSRAASYPPSAGGRGQHSPRHRWEHREGPELTWPPVVLRGDCCYQRCYQGDPMAATGLRGGISTPRTPGWSGPSPVNDQLQEHGVRQLCELRVLWHVVIVL